ncbi:hypothetical protein DEF24_12795 [Marinitenerispora sediminis]|uniref:Gram-positive cocci surface proteins LPxTG domain-containing protein n=1 Tax=Marinitenerispora sediminis TaxID=1931232 RepID=A0A368T8D3_9ACTN|nr:hypothetical protein DEF24_12795 [Marinitenerispora sediminis]
MELPDLIPDDPTPPDNPDPTPPDPGPTPPDPDPTPPDPDPTPPGQDPDDGQGPGNQAPSQTGSQPAADSSTQADDEPEELPVTGSDLSALMYGGLLAAGLGAVTVYAARRRPAQES